MSNWLTSALPKASTSPGAPKAENAVLPKTARPFAGGQQEIGVGRAELGGDLFGEKDGDPEELGGRRGQDAAAQAGLAFGHGLEEGRLDVHDEQGDAGGWGFGHARQTGPDSQ
jgi:hypothetical protein